MPLPADPYSRIDAVLPLHGAALARPDVFRLARLSLGMAALALFPLASPAHGQNAGQSLEDHIAELDSQAFAAFNAHDLERMLPFFATDLEFFHDQDGALTITDFIEASRRLFAQDNGLRRDLVPGSLEVHPIPGYGAIQIGRHRFCHFEGDREDCGAFGFTHVWRNLDGRWQITRVLSYGH